MSTITLKNIPAELHQALKQEAQHHGRSLNNEVLKRLQASLVVTRLEPKETLARIDKIRREHDVALDPELLQRALSEGRP